MQGQAPGAPCLSKLAQCPYVTTRLPFCGTFNSPQSPGFAGNLQSFTSEAELWRIQCTKTRNNQDTVQSRREKKTTLAAFAGNILSTFSCLHPKDWIFQTQPRESPLGNSEQSHVSFAFSGDQHWKWWLIPNLPGEVEFTAQHLLASHALTHRYLFYCKRRNRLNFNVKQLLPELPFATSNCYSRKKKFKTIMKHNPNSP